MHLQKKSGWSTLHGITNHASGLKREKHAHLASWMLHPCWDTQFCATPPECDQLRSAQSPAKESPQQMRLQRRSCRQWSLKAPWVCMAWCCFQDCRTLICDRTLGAFCQQCHYFGNCDLMHFILQYRTFWKNAFSRWKCGMSTSSK